ncbi:MAG: ATP-grasp domain-containing protein [Lentisphaerae bacterium]|nr:ATP-grasp domain-containing protein [Lentisphaerota bacterium]
MGDSLTVLVLGVGGNVSQGILKALALSRLPCRVVGACISPLALGLYTVHRSYVSPRADDPAFLDWLIAICRAEGVQAVLSGVEPVLTVLAQRAEEIREQTGAICVVSDLSRLLIGDDKLATCQWLERHGFNFPRYATSEDGHALTKLVAAYGYPLIAKPRFGKGGHGLIEVRSSSDLAYVSAQRDYVVQEYLGDSDSEYTAGCFCDRDGQVRGTIVMRRELLAGTTYRAKVGEFPEVRAEATRIAAALRPLGPCNVQLRISAGRPVCFEINVRFSGTTPLRARLGFNEVEAALRHYVLGEPADDLPLVTEGVVLRYWNEMYVDPSAYAALRQSGHLDAPRQFDLLVEDYGVRR